MSNLQGPWYSIYRYYFTKWALLRWLEDENNVELSLVDEYSVRYWRERFPSAPLTKV
jgi:hypothetical protein